MSEIVQSKDNQNLLGELQSRFRKSADSKSKRVQQCKRNLRYYCGDQIRVYDLDKKSFVEATTEQLAQDPRMVFNFLPSMIGALVSRMGLSDTQGEAVPATLDRDDISSARMVERLMDYIWEFNEGKKLSDDLRLAFVLMGRSYLRSWAEKDEKGVEIKSQVETMFNVYGPVGIPDDREWPWVIFAKPRTKQLIYKQYGLEPEHADLDEGGVDYAIFNLDSLVNGGFEPKQKEVCLVKEMFELPCQDHPKGRHVVWAGQTLLEEVEDWEDDLPMVSFAFYPLPGVHWCRGPLDHIINLQDAVNRVGSQIVNGVKLTMNPNILVDVESGVDEDALAYNTSKIIHYRRSPNGGGPPAYMIPGQIPPQAFDTFDRLIGLMGDIFGLHSRFQGEPPPSHTSGELFEKHIQQDFSKFGVVSRLWEASWNRVFRQWLRLAKKYFPDEKNLRLIGRSGQMEVANFRKTDLKPGLDVRVRPGSTMPKDKATERDKMILLVDKGIITRDPQTGQLPQQFWTALEMSNVDQFYDTQTGAIKQAEAENEKMLQGFSPHTYPAYNHPIHLKQVQKLIDSVEFLELEPEIKEIALKHRETHIVAVTPPPPPAPAGPSPGPEMMPGMMPENLPGRMQ